MSLWYYTPVAIHLVCNKVKSACSGVLLFNGQSSEHYVLTICDVTFPERQSYKLTAPLLIDSSSVSWVPLELVDVRYFQEDNDGTQEQSFYSLLKGFEKNNTFKLKPSPSERLSVLHLKVPERLREDISVKQLFDVNLLKPFAFKQSSLVPIPTKITIDCCPFSLTNTALFINHKLFGSVNYKTKTGQLYFSDVKYLDDTIGSAVTMDSTSSCLGLVAGALSKTNGDGEILVIASWDTIFGLLRYRSFNFSSPKVEQALTTQEAMSKGWYDPLASVVRISVNSSDGCFWGSGVIISNDLIVTNKHVVEEHSTINDLTISAPYSSKVLLKLSDVKIVSCPLVGFDLCFLQLQKPLATMRPAKICDSYASEMLSLQVGMPVMSIGYGLLFNDDTSDLKPFVNEGHINKIITRHLEDLTHLEMTMMIVSVACWNGSSGGGLFNTKGELVGIMTSNGKLSNGEVMANFTLSIPINIVSKCVKMLRSGSKPVELQTTIPTLWSLQNTHDNIDISPLAWKL